MAVGSGINVTVDTRELDFLVKDIQQFPERAIPAVKEQIETSAIEVRDGAKKHLKKRMRSPQSKSRIKHLPNTIQYRMEKTPERVAIEAVIEPERGRQLFMGAIIEGGAPNGTPASPPRPFLEPALRDEEPWLVRGMMLALEHEWGQGPTRG
jgi:hypothetical protein